MLPVSSLPRVNLVVKFDSACWTLHRVTSLTDCERHYLTYLTSIGSATPSPGVGPSPMSALALLPYLASSMVLGWQRLPQDYHVARHNCVELVCARHLRRKHRRDRQVSEAGLLNEGYSRGSGPHGDIAGALIPDKPSFPEPGID